MRKETPLIPLAGQHAPQHGIALDKSVHQGSGDMQDHENGHRNPARLVHLLENAEQRLVLADQMRERGQTEHFYLKAGAECVGHGPADDRHGDKQQIQEMMSGNGSDTLERCKADLRPWRSLGQLLRVVAPV